MTRGDAGSRSSRTDARDLTDRYVEQVTGPYAERATVLLEGYEGATSDSDRPEAELRAAADRWASFIREAHGDVFDRIDGTPDDAFVDAIAYDYAVDRLLDRVEAARGVRIANRESAANTDVLDLEFGRLHDLVEGSVGTNAEADADARPFPKGEPPPMTAIRSAVDGGFLRELYERTVDRSVRLALGQYYTPTGLAEVAVGSLDVDDHASDRVLDPACGSGVFLAACLREKRTALDGSREPKEIVDVLTDTVIGFDVNPVAVRSAKLRYALALGELVADDEVGSIEVPVFLTDAVGLVDELDAVGDVVAAGRRNRIEGERAVVENRSDGSGIEYGDGRLDPTAEHLVGNPPWITWGNLPESARNAWRESHVDRLGLLAHEGAESLLGYANDDVSVPFVWVCIDRYLSPGGSASVVLKRGLTKGPSGRLFRAGDVGDRSVAVTRIQDLTRLDPFGDDVTPDASVYTLRADREPSFPVPATSWSRKRTEAGVSFASERAMHITLTREETGYRPLDADDHAGSWIRSDADRRALGDCEVPIRHGVKDDAAAVFDVGDATLEAIEPDRVFPYLKSRHVVKYGLFGHDRRLVPMDEAHADNEAALSESYPATYEYLRRRRNALESRSSSWLDHGPFYNVFGLGEYTWANYKVVWCRLGFKPEFAVVSSVKDDELGEKAVVPGDHCMFVPTDDREEAHFLCGLLNSASYRRAIEGVTGGGKSGLSKSVVSKLALPRYPDTGDAARLADLSMRAHDIVPDHVDVSKREYNRTSIPELEPVQAAIDGLVEGMLATGALPTEE